MTIFLSNGTAHLARQPDGMPVRTFERKLFASTWTRTNRCHPTCLAFCSGCCYVDAIMSLCPGEELTHVHRNALCFGQRYDLFRIITQNSSTQHATIRSALERSIPSCPVIGFDRPYFVIVIHDTSVESGCVLGVDGGGSCRRQGYLLGRFSRKRYVLSNHIRGCIRIIAVFVQNKTRSNLIRSVGKLLSCGHTSCTCLILRRRTGGRQCALAVVVSLSTASSTLGLRFQFSQASSSVLQRSNWVSALSLSFAFSLSFSFDLPR